MVSDSRFDTAQVQRDLGRLAARGGAILFAGQAVQFVLSIASAVILARLLAPDDFGLVAMVAPFVSFIALFRDSGLQTATIQRTTVTHEQVSTLFWFNITLGFVLMVLVALLSPLIARFFGRGELFLITLAYALNILIGGASIQHSALLTRRMAFVRLTATAIISQIIGLVVGVLGAWFGLNYWALVAMTVSTTFTQTIITWWFSGWSPGLPHRGTGVGKMLAFGGGLTVSNLFNQVTQYLDTLLIGRMLGATSLGYYDRARQLFVMPLFQVMAPLSGVSIPTLSRLSDAPERYMRAYLRMQQALLMVTTAFSAFLVIYGDVVIRLLLGARWSPVGPVLQAFAIGGLIIPVSSSVAWLLVTQGRSRDLAYWSPFSLLFRCAAIVCGYPWGILGIAASIALFQYLSFIAFSIWAGRSGPVSTTMVLTNMRPSILAGIASCAVGLPVKATLVGASGIVLLSVGAIASVLVFTSTLWLMSAGRTGLVDAWNLAVTAIGKRNGVDDAK